MVLAWLLAQVLQLVFESFVTPDWVMKTVLVLLTAGWLLALFFAWAFDMTPDGIKLTGAIEEDQVEEETSTPSPAPLSEAV